MNLVLKKYVDYPLSNFDIMKLVKRKANIILYPDLHKYKSIDDVLGPYGVAFILFESKPQYGHWTLLFKLNDGTLEFYNPYGTREQGFPDDSLNFIPNDFAKKSNQDYPYLSKLLLKSPYQLSYNEIPFQKHAKNIKTCGRWSVFRLLNKHLSLYEFNDLIKQLMKRTRLSADEVVTLMTI